MAWQNLEQDLAEEFGELNTRFDERRSMLDFGDGCLHFKRSTRDFKFEEPLTNFYARRKALLAANTRTYTIRGRKVVVRPPGKCTPEKVLRARIGS